MMIEIRRVEVGTREARDFLNLPSQLYKPETCMQNRQEEEQQLAGDYILSPNYQFLAFTGYRDNAVRARVALILYPHQEVVYLGYFEAYDDETVVQSLFDRIKEIAREFGATRILGSIQASFWLGYRLRLNAFEESPFTGEPNQPAYYEKLWHQAGFVLKEKYLSNFYQVIPRMARQERLAKRYQQFLAKGYQILSPKSRDWERIIGEVFVLLSQLYADFPAFQAITEEQFRAIFADYRHILDFSMVKLAYFKGGLVGFLICLPDYGTLVYQKLTLFKLLKIFRLRHKAKRYLVLYMGVQDGHLGLGSALTYPIYQALQARQAFSIGALIHQGTVTQSYVSELQDSRHYYGLFQLDL